MKTILTPDARSRLANISLVDSTKADVLKRQLVGLHDQQKISIPVNDEQLKRILANLSKSRRDASIRRIKRGARICQKINQQQRKSA